MTNEEVEQLYSKVRVSTMVSYLKKHGCKMKDCTLFRMAKADLLDMYITYKEKFEKKRVNL